ncbi:VOC family protein [Haloechinothrix halophila]|uniref:VOC family protein n=1 Tax=Haloechinothrix halophila TaxID=1069073 RepID=UPI0018C89BE9|nr:VOC family protein [Haloechinothrix halophila]
MGQHLRLLGSADVFPSLWGLPTMTSTGTAIQPVLCSNDVPRLRAFYSDLFGAEQTFRMPDEGDAFFIGLRVGSSDLGIVADEQGAAAQPGRIIVTVFVDNVDDLLPKVEAAGGTLIGPANDMPWGHRVAHVADPDGNPVNITQVL